MPGSSAETAILVQTAENEVQYSVSRQRIRMTKEMESRESPVDAADAEVLSKVVFEFVSPLL